MDIPAKKLLRLLQRDQPLAVRCATALVLGEIGMRDSELGKSLCGCLEDEQAALRLEVIKAIGKLRIEPALPQLLSRIKEGGEEADQAAHAVARLGAKGTRALQELMPRVAPGLRRYIAAALAAGGTASAETAAVDVLLDKDPAVVEAAVRSFVGQAPTLTPSQRQGLADHVFALLDAKDKALSPESEMAVVRLLSVLEDPRAEAVLWDRVLAPHTPELRATALQALGKWVTDPNKDQLHRLVTCAADADFRVAAPALLLLKNVPLQDKLLAQWLPLLAAPDGTARHLAIDKLRDKDREDVAAAILGQLQHPDGSLRAKALACLTRMEHGQQALTAALLQADSADRAWMLARALAPRSKQLTAKHRQEILEQAYPYIEAGDRRADALLFLLREADGPALREQVEKRALAQRKKKEYASALHYLRLLVRDPSCGFPTRLELALCGLKQSSHDLETAARASDPCLEQFARLRQDYETELMAEMQKIDWLDPEDLYYLGFHFAEKGSRYKEFAAAVLRQVVKRSPRSKLGQAAKSKLHNAGLDE
jgi:hypothetical protein